MAQIMISSPPEGEWGSLTSPTGAQVAPKRQRARAAQEPRSRLRDRDRRKTKVSMKDYKILLVFLRVAVGAQARRHRVQVLSPARAHPKRVHRACAEKQRKRPY